MNFFQSKSWKIIALIGIGITSLITVLLVSLNNGGFIAPHHIFLDFLPFILWFAFVGCVNWVYGGEKTRAIQKSGLYQFPAILGFLLIAIGGTYFEIQLNTIAFITSGILGYLLFFVTFLMMRNHAVKNNIHIKWSFVFLLAGTILLSYCLGGVLGIKGLVGQMTGLFIGIIGSFIAFFILRKLHKVENRLNSPLAAEVFRSLSMTLMALIVVTFWYTFLAVFLIAGLLK
ncbi:hypothetical protein HZA42_04595 [Candidatus Peregrinibacteria bacterium]|nr:hypothetical protein [Candidatus Peregrinibacteria bacterium]